MIGGYQVSGRSRMIGTSGRFAPVCFASCLRHGGGKWSGETESDQDRIEQGNVPSFAFYQLHPTLLNGNEPVMVRMPEDENGIIEIYSTIGQKKEVFQLSEGSNTLNLRPVSQHGLVFYRILVNNEIKSEGKIVIIK